MDLPVNRFKQRLRSGEAQIGLWLGLADPYCAELAANAGFDWLLLDGEHAPNDLRSLLGQLQALAPYPGQPVIRPVQGDTALIKQLLDIGAQTLLVPMVDSAAQAEGLVRAVRYPPAGVRGVGSALARASRWNSVAEYLDHADEQMCLLVQVENLEGLANLDAIAAVEGVDGVFIGPTRSQRSHGPSRQSRPSRGAGGHRGRHPPHPRGRQGRRHPLRRRGAGAALPGAGLRVRRGGRGHQPADAFAARAGGALQGRRAGAVRQFLGLRLRGAPRSRSGRGARSALRQVSASVRGRMPSVGGTMVAARSPSGRRARSSPPAP